MTSTLEHTLCCILIEKQFQNDMNALMGEIALRDMMDDKGLQELAELKKSRAQKYTNIGRKGSI